MFGIHCWLLRDGIRQKLHRDCGKRRPTEDCPFTWAAGIGQVGEPLIAVVALTAAEEHGWVLLSGYALLPAVTQERHHRTILSSRSTNALQNCRFSQNSRKSSCIMRNSINVKLALKVA